ncbi:MAG TPA: hypothetical protein VIJ59_06745 [Caulobacteraceae bacterium]
MAQTRTGKSGLVIGVIGVAFAVFMVVFFNSGAAKGWLFASSWDGKSPLTCGGSQQMTIRNKHIKMDTGPVFDVGGDCKLNIIDSDITAPTVLDAGGHAHVTFEGGSMTAGDKAITGGGDARVEIHGTKIVGAIDKGGSMRITGLPEFDKQQAAEDADKALNDKWGKSACAGIVECYRNAHFVGQAGARVIGELDASGRVSAVTITGTPGPQRDCLDQVMKAKAVAVYDGGKGRLVCEFAGTWAAGNEDLTIGGTFQR